MTRFIHTSDWQIGKVYRYLSPEAAAVLQQARLEAITTIGGLAREHGAAAVLVAGDVYDLEGPSDRTLLQPIERMRAFPDTAWHLLPGNHDPERSGGLWERLERSGLPENVILHRTPRAAPLEDGAWVLPAPLTRKRASLDPTQTLDEMETSEGAIRIGLAHGSVVQFGSGETTTNLISRERVERARLDYLALGDWHGFKIMGERLTYSGTPEVDGFGIAEGGFAALVTIAGLGALPEITPVRTGQYEWVSTEAHLSGDDDVEVLANRLAEGGSDPARTLVRIEVSGTLSLAGYARFEDEILRRMDATLFHLDVEKRHLLTEATEEDLDAIDRSGFVRHAIERLRELAADPRDPRSGLVPFALQRLYVEHQKHQRGA